MRISWIAASTLLGLALLAPAAEAQQKIAVVHVSDVVSGMAEGKKAGLASQTRSNDAQIEKNKRGTDIQNMQGQLGQLKAGSAQWNDLRSQLEDKQMEYQVWLKKTEVRLGRAAKDDLKKMFDHVNEATQEVAIAQHINLVIADAAPEVVGPELDGLTFQQFGSLLSQRVVLFSDKTVDITQDVITRVDSDFAKQQGAAGAPVAPPVVAPAPAPIKK